MKPLILRDHEVRRLLDVGSVAVVREVTKPPRARETWAAHSMRRCLYGDGWSWHDENGNCHNCDWTVRCPIGREGEQRWVRETWSLPPGHYDLMTPREIPKDAPLRYAVDGAVRGDGARFVDHLGRFAVGRRRPSVHMPRWASRAVVEVEAVRVARVQNLAAEDAISAGVIGTEQHDHAERAVAGGAPHGVEWLAFAYLWQAINGREAWDANPWVWVASVSRVEAA